MGEKSPRAGGLPPPGAKRAGHRRSNSRAKGDGFKPLQECTGTGETDLERRQGEEMTGFEYENRGPSSASPLGDVVDRGRATLPRSRLPRQYMELCGQGSWSAFNRALTPEIAAMLQSGAAPSNLRRACRACVDAPHKSKRRLRWAVSDSDLRDESRP